MCWDKDAREMRRLEYQHVSSAVPYLTAEKVRPTPLERHRPLLQRIDRRGWRTAGVLVRQLGDQIA